MLPADEVAPLTVLYVAGCWRSGTTLLGNILNEVDGCFDAGELRWLWSDGHPDRATCGCGLSHRYCPVWSCVLRTEIAPGVTLDARLPELTASLMRFRIRHTSLRLRPPTSAAAAADLHLLAALYRAI